MKGAKDFYDKGMQEIQQTVIQVQEATPLWQQIVVAAVGALVSVIAGYYCRKWWKKSHSKNEDA